MGIWQKLTCRLIDTHCHLHHYDNPEKLIASVKEQGIKVHLVTVHPSEYTECLKLTADCENIHVSLGMFPLYIDKYSEEMDFFTKVLPDCKFIGEIGLDYTVEEREREAQRLLFKEIISKCDELGGKVLSVHSRRSADDVFKIIGDDFNGTVIMHWYSGSAELVKNAPENVYFSVNPAMLKSRQGKEVLAALPRNKVLTETDGPYIKLNEKPAVPADISITVNALSTRWGCSIERLRFI
jgi:TatD DNase family protein